MSIGVVSPFMGPPYVFDVVPQEMRRYPSIPQRQTRPYGSLPKDAFSASVQSFTKCLCCVQLSKDFLAFKIVPYTSLSRFLLSCSLSVHGYRQEVMHRLAYEGLCSFLKVSSFSLCLD